MGDPMSLVISERVDSREIRMRVVGTYVSGLTDILVSLLQGQPYAFQG